MYATQRRDIGYTFWLCNDVYSLNDLKSYIRDQEYSLDSAKTFIVIPDSLSISIPWDQIIRIPHTIIDNKDQSLESVIRTMSYRPIITITGRSCVDDLLIITRIMGESFCTIIEGFPSILNTMNHRIVGKSVWIKDGDFFIPSSIHVNDISIFKAIQYNHGNKIDNLRKVTSYLQSCLDWNDTTLAMAGIINVDQYIPDKMRNIIFNNKCHCIESWNFKSYRLICVDNIESIMTIPDGKRAMRLDGIIMK